MEGLKYKTLHNAKWSLLEKVVSIGFEFAVGIALARLLSPSDFGTIAIISVIISVSLIFVNSGISQSLVRHPDVSNKDYSTIFIFNLIIGTIFYIILYLLSKKVADFYQNIPLAFYIKILGLSIFISSFTIIQRVSLTRDLNFKLMSKVSIFSSLFSGGFSLVLAFCGFGIWSLIAKTLSREIIQTTLLWLNNKWKPSFVFDSYIFKKHFKYGANFLLSSIIGQVYNNILALTIGKVYNLQTLGYYNRAQLFSNTVLENIGGVMTSVSFPALAKVQDNKDKFTEGVRLLLKQTGYVIGVMMIIMFFSAKSFIPFLLGEQWAMAGGYLQFLSVIGFFGVFNSVLINSISVTGRSNIYLYFQIWALVLNIVGLIFGYFYGIETMLSILIVFFILSYFLVSSIFNTLFQYSIKDQINDFRSILIVFFVIISIGIIFTFLFDNSIINTSLMVFVQIFSVFLVSSFLKIDEFQIIKKIYKYEKNN